MKKKLMLLGGLRYLIPVIKTAQKMGCHVITCDYLPENIAHKFADEYHNVSILDKSAVLTLAKRLKIDGIMSFAVDPGVITAGYVAEQLNLPSPGPLKSIEILQNKGLFRAFLKANDFNVPYSKTYSNIDNAVKEATDFELPVIIKPVDSAGSKGVVKVEHYDDFLQATQHAISFSRSKTIIVEEFLEAKVFSSDTDSFALDGEFKFISFSNQRFDPKSPNPFTPAAYSWPSSISKKNQILLKSELQRLISLLKMKSSVYNIEVRESVNGKAYIMEVSPRGGGNRLSEMIHYATGTDLITCAIQAALGLKVTNIGPVKYNGFWAEIILYSNQSGKFKEVYISDKIKKHVIETDIWVKKGDLIKSFTGANEAIGTLVARFENSTILEQFIGNYRQYVQVIIQ